MYIDIKELENDQNQLELIEDFGEPPWNVSVFFNSTDGIYYAKGPFGRWDSICYIRLINLKSKADVTEWIRKAKEARRL